MGIGRVNAKCLMNEGNKRKFFGRVLVIGRQDIHASIEILKKWAKYMDFDLKANFQPILSEKDKHKNLKWISNESFFKLIGFENVDSIDYSDYEHASIVHDLNKDIPTKLYRKYDLIFDGGTSEHIFNIPKLFENYNKMLKIGGRIIHAVPVSNFIDHGFYMFSPILFQNYYSLNKWKILDSFLIKLSSKEKSPAKVFEYDPKKTQHFVFGGYDGIYGFFFVAKKTNTSTFNADIQQSFYSQKWNKRLAENSIQVNKKFKNFVQKFVEYKLGNKYHHKLLKLFSKYRLKLVARY